MNKYELKIGSKTRLLNVFRKIFTVPFFESLLVKTSQNTTPESFIGKIIPPSYLYPKNSIRSVIRNGFNFELDINDMVDHYIYYNYAEPSFNTLFNLVKKGMIVLDIGANIGQTSMNFSKHTGADGKVYCFEPDPVNFNKLSQNIKLNKMVNVKLFQLGLGNENKTAKLFNVYNINRGMCRVLENTEDNFEYSEITIQTLDSFCEQKKIERIDLIKIDVEGFELNVLKGAEKILKKFKPVLFVEMDDEYLKEHGFDSKRLLEFLFFLNYTVTNAENGQTLLTTMNFSKCHYDIIAR